MSNLVLLYSCFQSCFELPILGLEGKLFLAGTSQLCLDPAQLLFAHLYRWLRPIQFYLLASFSKLKLLLQCFYFLCLLLILPGQTLQKKVNKEELFKRKLPYSFH